MLRLLTEGPHTLGGAGHSLEEVFINYDGCSFLVCSKYFSLDCSLCCDVTWVLITKLPIFVWFHVSLFLCVSGFGLQG